MSEEREKLNANLRHFSCVFEWNLRSEDFFKHSISIFFLRQEEDWQWKSLYWVKSLNRFFRQLSKLWRIIHDRENYFMLRMEEINYCSRISSEMLFAMVEGRRANFPSHISQLTTSHARPRAVWQLHCQEQKPSLALTSSSHTSTLQHSRLGVWSEKVKSRYNFWLTPCNYVSSHGDLSLAGNIMDFPPLILSASRWKKNIFNKLQRDEQLFYIICRLRVGLERVSPRERKNDKLPELEMKLWMKVSSCVTEKCLILFSWMKLKN